LLDAALGAAGRTCQAMGEQYLSGVGGMICGCNKSSWKGHCGEEKVK